MLAHDATPWRQTVVDQVVVELKDLVSAPRCGSVVHIEKEKDSKAEDDTDSDLDSERVHDVFLVAEEPGLPNEQGDVREEKTAHHEEEQTGLLLDRHDGIDTV